MTLEDSIPVTAPVPPRVRRGARHDGLALAAIGVAVVAGIADPDVARDMVAIGGIGSALAVILGRLRRPPAAFLPSPSSDVAARTSAEADIDAKAHFLALAAHEIRTPLTGILGLADLLGETVLSGEQTAYVDALRASGTTLLRMVDGYLDLNRLEAGHVRPTPIATSLEAVVEDVIELLAPPCQAKGLELAGYVAPSLSSPVLVDPLLLRQVLINLAGNAVKFTETGGVAVEVERAAGEEGDGVVFRVRDTGIGIEAAEASRIFDAWERIETEGVASAAGTGLGLAIARGIVERMGGTIGLVSRPGEGSIFAFELSLPTVGADGPVARPLRGRRIGLISRAVVEPPLLVRRLHALGAEACLVDDAETLTRLDPCDVVLIDAQGGLDAAATLADLRARGGTAPAVVLIPPAARGSLPSLRSGGFSAHLIRPVRPASLARVVALAARDTAATATVSMSSPLGSGLRVLLVDDNEINALLGRAALEHAGHDVEVAVDGESALADAEAARAEGNPYSVILMDLHMPGLDGFSAIRALRAAETPFEPRALVLAVTADATPEAAERARACGADAVLVKPIDRDRLAKIVMEFRDPSRVRLERVG